MYFFLGNSNSLASIDVSAGYVGLEDYVPGVVGPLMYVATYCGPILWLIAAVLSIVRDAQDIKRSDCGTDIGHVIGHVTCGLFWSWLAETHVSIKSKVSIFSSFRPPSLAPSP